MDISVCRNGNVRLALYIINHFHITTISVLLPVIMMERFIWYNWTYAVMFNALVWS